LQNGKKPPEKKTYENPGVIKTRNGKWRAQIGINHGKICLGTYVLKEDAIAARKAAEQKYYEKAAE
jgi:hypothetical protein